MHPPHLAKEMIVQLRHRVAITEAKLQMWNEEKLLAEFLLDLSRDLYPSIMQPFCHLYQRDRHICIMVPRRNPQIIMQFVYSYLSLGCICFKTICTRKMKGYMPYLLALLGILQSFMTVSLLLAFFKTLSTVRRR